MQAGDRLGSYEILRAIGAGGMGEVFLARDTRLGRQAAIKILPRDVAKDDDRLKRFEQEAKLASSLNHPSIATVYDIGDADGVRFIAMEYVDGETLAVRLKRGPLSVRESLDIGIQVADALRAAHDGGVTHRDIKPDNVMLRPDGYVKVLDFGLAKLTRPAGTAADDAATISASLTQAGSIVGTVNYMSPEQARGERVDHRTDIFSLGVVLFESLTAKRPFSGATMLDTLAAILNRDPGAPSAITPAVPAELDRIIAKAMRKDLGERYMSIGEMLNDLKALRRQLDSGASPTPRGYQSKLQHMRGVAIAVAVLSVAIGALISRQRVAPPPAKTAIQSLAVMPFKHAGADQAMAYLADGLTDSVTSNLSQLNDLRVMSRTTIDRFKDKDPLQAARDLAVQAVLVGTVEPRGDAVTISLELINVDDGRQLWGKQYPRPIADLVKLQADISGEVAANLQPKLTGREQQQVTQEPTANSAAYQLYLRGRFYARQQTEDSLKSAIDFYTQALALDPRFLRAHVALAEAYIIQGTDSVAAKDAMPKAAAEAVKAIEIDPTSADAHAALGIVKLTYDWDWKGAAQELQSGRALESPTIEAFSCALHFADPLGRNQDAIAALQSAVASSPQSLPDNLELGCASYYGRQYDQAIRQFRGTLAIYPNHPLAMFSLARSLTQLGKTDEAIAVLQDGIKANGSLPTLVSELGYAFARAGKRGQARATLGTLADLSKKRYVDPYLVASVQIGMSDTDAAFSELSRAVDERSASLPWLKVEPKWDAIRTDPRFNELLRRVGLPPGS